MLSLMKPDIAEISHVMRTHLNGVMGMAYLLRDTPLSTEQENYLDTLQESAESLLRYVNAMILHDLT